jgi:hypothetical protein
MRYLAKVPKGCAGREHRLVLSRWMGTTGMSDLGTSLGEAHVMMVTGFPAFLAESDLRYLKNIRK